MKNWYSVHLCTLIVSSGLFGVFLHMNIVPDIHEQQVKYGVVTPTRRIYGWPFTGAYVHMIIETSLLPVSKLESTRFSVHREFANEYSGFNDLSRSEVNRVWTSWNSAKVAGNLFFGVMTATIAIGVIEFWLRRGKCRGPANRDE